MAQQIARNYMPENLNAILASFETLPPVGVISWRGILTKIVCSPFLEEEWRFNVKKKNNILFFQEPLDKLQSTPSEYEKRAMYWGRRFEVVCTDGEDAPVNTNCELGAVYNFKINNNRFILGAELDAVRCESKEKSSLEMKDFVEFKTCKWLCSERDRWYFERKKLPKFWAQCFLAGISKLVVGFRDKNGMLKTCESFEVSKIPSIVRNKSSFWDPNVGLSVLDELVNKLQAELDEDACCSVSFSYPFKEIIIKPHETKDFDYLDADLLTNKG